MLHGRGPKSSDLGARREHEQGAGLGRAQLLHPLQGHAPVPKVIRKLDSLRIDAMRSALRRGIIDTTLLLVRSL